MIKQIGLAVGLIALPVGLFAGVEHWMVPGQAVAGVVGPSMGDMAPLKAIVTDVQGLVGKGDLPGAAARITDLETAWDDDQAVMQALNPVAWGGVDGLIDTSLKSLRAGSPDAAKVTAALVALQAGLDNPGGSAGSGGVVMVQGIAVTDAGGHALPCEVMIDAVRGKAAGGLSEADKATVTDLAAKATERCNADDDQHADAFSAAALALLGGGA